MSRLIPFESIVVGTELGPIDTDVSAKAMAAYQKDWDDPNPWYSDASPFGGPIAPPAFMAGLTGFQLLSTRFNTRATIGVRTAYESVAPIAVGQTMKTVGRIADKYVKRDLEYVVVESTSYDEAGILVRRGTDHILLSFERVSDLASVREAQ
jgi:acyl dehydratase